MHSLARRLLIGVGGTGVAVIAAASPAFAGTVTQPTFTTVTNPDGSTTTTPYTIPVGSNGNPQAFTVSGTGFTAPGPVYIELCDGVSPSTPQYDVNVHCDAASSNAGKPVPSSSATESFPANDPNFAIEPFRGVSPQDQYNCLAPQDVKPGTSPNKDGSVTPIGSTTANGNPIDTGVPSWTNCQLRMATSEVNSTGDQVYEPTVEQNTPATTPPPATPEVPLAAILPVGAAALFAAGFGINRRRNRRTAA